MNGAGEVIAAPAPDEDLVLAISTPAPATGTEPPDECEPSTRRWCWAPDYSRKCGFSRVLIGLSGGIDSSLTAAIAVEAVGRENVTGVAMPGPYSSDHSLMDAREMAVKLGIQFAVVSISGVCGRFEQDLTPALGGPARRVTEKTPARLRECDLVLENAGALVLTTGNPRWLALSPCTPWRVRSWLKANVQSVAYELADGDRRQGRKRAAHSRGRSAMGPNSRTPARASWNRHPQPGARSAPCPATDRRHSAS